MGRVKDFKELGKKGPGRKSRKQGEPDVPPALRGLTEKSSLDGKVTKLGGRIKQRAKKRLLRKVAVESTKKLSKKGKKESMESEEEEEDDDEMDVSNNEEGIFYISVVSVVNV